MRPGACARSVRAISVGWSSRLGCRNPSGVRGSRPGRGSSSSTPLWRGKRIAVEADGRAYHLSPADWEADLQRQNAIHGEGVVLLRYPVVRLRAEAAACGDEMRRLIA
jgi:hypothetical protein